MTETPVVLLHGLGRTRVAMLPLAYHLRKRGFRPINVGYFGPAGLAASLQKVSRSLERLLEPHREGPVHFVTHSMGGIVARAFLASHAESELGIRGRLVQLAPPNQGAWLADAVRRVPLLDHVPAFYDLGYCDTTGGAPLKDAPPISTHEVGVIAGRSYGPWHGKHWSDGVVRVAETYLPEAQDWILLDHFHTVVMNGRDTWANVVSFLEEGSFLPGAPRLELDPRAGVRVR